jgi:peptidoglycan hydrolase-like protein with peptidoglycan-binding domain
MDPSGPAETEAGAGVVCSAQRVNRTQMTNARQRAVWDVKDRLCCAGGATDPGPINGEITSTLQSAIQRFQRDNGLDVTGRLDSSTLSSLGFSWFAAQGIANALKGTVVGPETSITDVVIPVLVIGGIGIGGFFAYKRFIRRG